MFKIQAKQFQYPASGFVWQTIEDEIEGRELAWSKIEGWVAKLGGLRSDYRVVAM